MSPKRILNVDLFYLLQVYRIFIDFRKKEPVSNFRLIKFFCRGGLTGKF